MGLTFYGSPMSTATITELVLAELEVPHERVMLDIQKGKPQTALTFSGRRALGVSEVVDAILGPVLRDRPMEIALPLSRGLIAKFGNAFPALGARALAGMTRSGLKRQQQIAAGKDPTQK